MSGQEFHFDVLTASNKDSLTDKGKFCQVWGVIITKVLIIGDMKTIGVAINENLIMNLVIPEEHQFLPELIEIGEEIIGK